LANGIPTVIVATKPDLVQVTIRSNATFETNQTMVREVFLVLGLPQPTFEDLRIIEAYHRPCNNF